MIYKNLNTIFRRDIKLYFMDSYGGMFIKMEEGLFLYFITTKDFEIHHGDMSKNYVLEMTEKNKYIGNCLFKRYKDKFVDLHKFKQTI